MSRIYVAAPYSHPDPAVRQLRVERVLAVGLDLLQQGHAPFLPHLFHFFDAWAQQRTVVVPYAAYMAWDAAYLAVCDGVLGLGSSPGVAQEVAEAERLGLPVYRSPADVPPPRR